MIDEFRKEKNHREIPPPHRLLNEKASSSLRRSKTREKLLSLKNFFLRASKRRLKKSLIIYFLRSTSTFPLTLLLGLLRSSQLSLWEQKSSLNNNQLLSITSLILRSHHTLYTCTSIFCQLLNFSSDWRSKKFSSLPPDEEEFIHETWQCDKKRENFLV